MAYPEELAERERLAVRQAQNDPGAGGGIPCIGLRR
jgi:hypothetical protein